jgi:hypothetical protein
MVFYLIFMLIFSIDASGPFLPSIFGGISVPDDVFQKRVFPYLYQLPKYFVLLSCQEDEYYLVNKKWSQLWTQFRPSLGDLLYHYNMVHGRHPFIFERSNQTVHDILHKHKITNPLNLKMIAYLKECDRDTFDLIAGFRDVIIEHRYVECDHVACDHVKNIDPLCAKIINKGIYYWEGFSLLFWLGYRHTWKECYQHALKKGLEDNRDLRLIGHRYQYDLAGHRMNGTDFNFLSADPKPLEFISKKELCIYQIERNPNLIKNFLNDFPFITEIFNSYKGFKKEKVVQEFYEKNQDFISNFFYTQFKHMYDQGHESLAFMDKGEFRKYKEMMFLIDFLIHTRSFVLQIIANKTVNDQEVCFLFTYGTLAFQHESDFNDLKLNYSQIVGLIDDFPISFNRRCEDSFYLYNNFLDRVIHLQNALRPFRRAQHQKSPEKFIEKLRSFKKIIEYKKIELFKLGVLIGALTGVCWFIFKHIQNASQFEKNFVYVLFSGFIGLMLRTLVFSDFFKLCQARFIN